MFDTTSFLSDPILSQTQAGVSNTDPILIRPKQIQIKSSKSKENVAVLLNRINKVYISLLLQIMDYTRQKEK